MINLLGLLWFFRTIKEALLYLYLWQLKEYKLGRFLAHFSTAKGKNLLINPIKLLKATLFVSLFIFKNYSPLVVPLLSFILLLYFVEVIFAVDNIFKRRVKRPVFTLKSVLLIAAVLIFEAGVLLLLQPVKNQFVLTALLLLLDILTLVFVSLLVGLFQAVTLLLKRRIINQATEKRAQSKNLLVVGITGSCGKTSTKEFLTKILSERFKVLKTPQNKNNEFGISFCILKELTRAHQIFVCEMGAYRQGDIALLSRIAQPKIGILTGINQQHLALFGSQEKIIEAKFELLGSLPESGVGILNGDNEFIAKSIEGRKLPVQKKKFCSVVQKMDIWAENINVERGQLCFKAFTKEGDSADFKVNVCGAHNVLNVLMAAVCAKELGMSLSEISRACSRINPEDGGMKIYKNKKDLEILDSSYSANPDGVMATLEYLQLYPGKKIIVMPCLIELGSAAKEVHKKIGEKLAGVCDLAIITSKDYLKEVKDGAIGKGMKEENILFLEKAEEIADEIESFSEAGNVVLLEGRVPAGIKKYLINKT